MGDRGGKKNKDKSQKQNKAKQEKQNKMRRNKQAVSGAIIEVKKGSRQ